ncbi:MAG: phage recombination protein Bet [Thiofilum sp.]|uniref:phage recombination protein Bet n=1 Tax=Thiofilum sp. TaxID=2212733 RepID=UPI0025D6FD24|nr:phage recombination protein Bet [Thiofilum sp.]MBK8455623.1 phage recombination protein Bet [Thiofilum sp.]
MTTELMVWNEDQIDLIKQQVCKGATDDELKLFLYTAKRTGLDPLARQIYAMRRYDNNLKREVMSIGTSIDGFRLIAERSGDYAGQVGPFWCGDDGVWVDVWLKSTPPVAAKLGVMRTKFKEPLYAVAMYSEYVQKYKDKETKQWKVTPMWSKMPTLMLAKVAESLALRKAFPQELSSIYTKEEFPSESDLEEVKQIQTQVEPIAFVAQSWVPSKDQLTRLFTIAATNGYTKPAASELLQARYGLASSKELTKEQYDDLCKYMEAYPVTKLDSGELDSEPT